jgi:Zn-finger protein
MRVFFFTSGESMSYKFFENKECEYYPCHDLKEYEMEKMNCLFCYCPLYRDEDCGGNCVVLGNGIKDCSGCLIPHSEGGYAWINKKLMEKYEATKLKAELDEEYKIIDNFS